MGPTQHPGSGDLPSSIASTMMCLAIPVPFLFIDQNISVHPLDFIHWGILYFIGSGRHGNPSTHHPTRL